MGQAIQLNVKVQGRGFPILCLHGHPGSAQSMAVFTDSLSQRFRTIAPDLRGYGRSQVNQDFEMIDHLLDLQALLDSRGIDRCLVLGWSLGGILALELALQYPERISGLILVATAARPFGNHPPITWQDDLYTGIASVLNCVKPGWPWNIETFGKRSLYRYLVQQHTSRTYRYLAQHAVSAYLKTSGAANRALQTAMRQGYDRGPELSRIHQPCLILAATADRHINALASQQTASGLPNSQYKEYENAAHLFPWEVPGLVTADIQQWLQSHPEAINWDEQCGDVV